MKNKNLILIIGGLATLTIIAFLVAMMKSEKSLFKSTSGNNDTMDALIENYDELTDYNTQLAVWMHVFKNCPYWKAMVQEQFELHGSGEGGNIETRYAIEADYCISKGRNPVEYMKKCNDNYQSTIDAYNECQKKKKSSSTWRWIAGIASLGFSEIKPISSNC